MDKRMASESMSPYPDLPPPPPPYEAMPSAPPSMMPIVMAPPQQHTVTVIVDDGKFGPYPRTMKCHHCMESIVTKTSTKSGALAYILGAVLCIVGCFCGCCLIPCCISSTQDIMHKCPNCNKFLGAYERIKLRR